MERWSPFIYPPDHQNSTATFPVHLAPATARTSRLARTPAACTFGGASANTEGTTVGSARRNSSYPMPARPVINPGDSTANGFPHSHPFCSMLSRTRAAILLTSASPRRSPSDGLRERDTPGMPPQPGGGGRFAFPGGKEAPEGGGAGRGEPVQCPARHDT